MRNLTSDSSPLTSIFVPNAKVQLRHTTPCSGFVRATGFNTYQRPPKTNQGRSQALWYLFLFRRLQSTCARPRTRVIKMVRCYVSRRLFTTSVSPKGTWHHAYEITSHRDVKDLHQGPEEEEGERRFHCQYGLRPCGQQAYQNVMTGNLMTGHVSCCSRTILRCPTQSNYARRRAQ